MSLRQLLLTNHCVAETRDHPGKYKVVKRDWMPKFSRAPTFRSSVPANSSTNQPDASHASEPGRKDADQRESAEVSSRGETEEAESPGEGADAEQTELNLMWHDDRFSQLQAIRNDLNDTDLELVSGKPVRQRRRERAPEPTAESGDRAENPFAWGSVATRLMAVSKFLF